MCTYTNVSAYNTLPSLPPSLLSSLSLSLTPSPSPPSFHLPVNSLENEESEAKLKCVFVEVRLVQPLLSELVIDSCLVIIISRESLSETIITDLANYRHKRIMGLAGMFGDHLLTSMCL